MYKILAIMSLSEEPHGSPLKVNSSPKVIPARRISRIKSNFFMFSPN